MINAGATVWRSSRSFRVSHIATGDLHDQAAVAAWGFQVGGGVEVTIDDKAAGAPVFLLAHRHLLAPSAVAAQLTAGKITAGSRQRDPRALAAVSQLVQPGAHGSAGYLTW